MDKILDKKLDKHFGNFWRWGGRGGTPLAVMLEDCLVLILSPTKITKMRKSVIQINEYIRHLSL